MVVLTVDGVRVMPLGDSITDGFGEPGALGDHDHEGHSGWRIDELDAGVVSWIRSANPRTVLMHAGTNDLIKNHDVANAPARLGAVLEERVRASSNGSVVATDQRWSAR